jgi:hypothetical protein
MSENQLMIHILNNLTSDYELQLAMMERGVGDIEKPLTLEEIRGELSLRYERLNMKSSSNIEGKVLDENAFLWTVNHTIFFNSVKETVLCYPLILLVRNLSLSH